MPMQLAVLISGGGSTLQNLIEHIHAGKLEAEIACVISSKRTAGGLERAEQHGIPGHALPLKDYAGDLATYNRDLWNAIRRYRPGLVVLAGWMSMLEIPGEYVNRIINIHPALIPSFSGKGMYGLHVHRAVLDYGVKITGVTIHLVDDQYDHGPIVMQEPVAVLDNDTPESLMERVQVKEREMYPQAIQWFAEGRVTVDGRHVRIAAPAGEGAAS